MVPRDRIELPTRGFSELYMVHYINDINRLGNLGCGFLDSVGTLYAPFFHDLPTHRKILTPLLYFMRTLTLETMSVQTMPP